MAPPATRSQTLAHQENDDPAIPEAPISPATTKTSPSVSKELPEPAAVEIGPDAVEPEALSKALSDLEAPSRKRQRVYGDRFLPNRSGRDLQAGYSLLHDDGSPATPARSKKRPGHDELHFQRSELCRVETDSAELLILR